MALAGACADPVFFHNMKTLTLRLLEVGPLEALRGFRLPPTLYSVGSCPH